jgi:hypothetical protein
MPSDYFRAFLLPYLTLLSLLLLCPTRIQAQDDDDVVRNQHRPRFTERNGDG